MALENASVPSKGSLQRHNIERLPTELYAIAFFVGELIGGVVFRVAELDRSLDGLVSLGCGILATFGMHLVGSRAKSLHSRPSFTGPVYILLIFLGGGLSMLVAYVLEQAGVSGWAGRVVESLPLPIVLIVGETFGRRMNWTPPERAHTASHSFFVFSLSFVVSALLTSGLFGVLGAADISAGRTVLAIIVILLSIACVFYADYSDRTASKGGMIDTIRPDRCPLYLFLLLIFVFVGLYQQATQDVQSAERLLNSAKRNLEKADANERSARLLENAGNSDAAGLLHDMASRARATAEDDLCELLGDYGKTNSATQAGKTARRPRNDKERASGESLMQSSTTLLSRCAGWAAFLIHLPDGPEWGRTDSFFIRE